MLKMTFQDISDEYKKKGFSRESKRKTKLAEYAVFQKDREGFLNFGCDAEYLYHIEGNVTVAHMNDFLKRYQQVYDDYRFDSKDCGILSYTGNLDTREFRKIARTILDEDQYSCMKLKKQKSSTTSSKPKQKIRLPRIKRVKLAKAQQTLILKSQHYKCALCKEDISKITPEFDHRIPLALGGSEGLTNIQALCPNCHREKTAKDQLEISRARRK